MSYFSSFPTSGKVVLIIFFLLLFWGTIGIIGHYLDNVLLLAFFYILLSLVTLGLAGLAGFYWYIFSDDEYALWFAVPIILCCIWSYFSFDEGKVYIHAYLITSSESDAHLSAAISGILNEKPESDQARTSRKLVVQAGEPGFVSLKNILSGESGLEVKERLLIALAEFDNVEGCYELINGFEFEIEEDTENRDRFNQSLVSKFRKFDCTKYTGSLVTAGLDKARQSVVDLGSNDISFSIKISSEEGTADSLSNIQEAVKITAALFGITVSEIKSVPNKHIEIIIEAEALGAGYGSGLLNTSYSAAYVKVKYAPIGKSVVEFARKTELPSSIRSIDAVPDKEDAPYNHAFPKSRFMQLYFCDIFKLYEHNAANISEVARWIYATEGAKKLTKRISQGDDSIKWQPTLESESLAVLNEIAMMEKKGMEKFKWSRCV